MSSTPTTPTQSSSFLPNAENKSNTNMHHIEPLSRTSSSSSTSEERGPETPPTTHPNSPYANSRAYPRLHTTPFATDPLDAASRRDSSNALRASVLNVFAELGALEQNSQYADWMFGGLPGWEEGQNLPQNPNRRALGAGVRFQSGSRFRERLDSRGSSMALLDGYIRLTRNSVINEGSDDEDDTEEERGWAGSRFWRPRSRSKSRTRSKSRQRKDKERDIKFKDTPVPREGEDRSARRKSVWRKSLRASGYESDGAAASVSTSLIKTFTKNKPIKRMPSQTRKEDISRPLPQRRSGVPSAALGTPTTPSGSSSDGQPTIPSYTTPFPLLGVGTPLGRSISHDDANPRTNRQSLQTLNTLNTLVLEEQWDKVDPLSTIDFQTLNTFENPFVGTGKLKKKPPKAKAQKQGSTTTSRVASPLTVPDLAPVPIVATASTSGSPGKKPRRNVPNMIEVPLQDQSAFPVPFPHSPSNSSLTNLPPLPRSVASDSIPVPSHPLYSNNFTDAPPSISEASANDGHDNTGGTGGGLFSRLARPFLSSQSSSKRSIKTSKATPPVQAIATTMEANGAAATAVPSTPSTPKSNNGAGSGPRTPQSPLSKPGSSHGQGSDRVSEDSSRLTVGHSSRPGTPLSPLSKALERGSLDETKRRVPATPTEPVAFPRVSSGSDTEVGGWRGGIESGWVDEID